MAEVGGFHEVQFPLKVSYGSSFGPGFSTHITKLSSAHEQRVGRQETPIHRANAAYAVKSHADLMEVKTFFNARKGALYAFRFRDWQDYTTADDGKSAAAFDDQLIGLGTGSQTQWQLVKRYESGGFTTVYNVRKPTAGTILVGKNGAPMASGWSVDPTTGIITFSVAPLLGDTLTWGGEFDIPMRFDRSADEWLEARITSFEEGSVPPILLVEDPGAVAVASDYFYGGGEDITFADDISISTLRGRSLRLNATVASKSVHLPDPTPYEIGGPYWFVENAGANSIAFKVGGSTLFTLTAGSFRTIALFAVSPGKAWRGF